MSRKESEYGSVTANDTRGETPLLASSIDNYETTYTTYISEDRDGDGYDDNYYDDRDSKDEKDDSDEEEMTEVEESSGDAPRRHVDDDVDEIEELVKQAQGMEKKVKEQMTTMPPWMLRICVLFFTLLAVVELVGGILYVFDIVATYQTVIQWITVIIAILGNCLGSCAVFYSGSFKQEVKSLARGVKSLQAASDQLKEHVEAMFRNRGALTRTKCVLEDEIDKIEEDVQNFQENEKVIVDTAFKIDHNARVLERENTKLSREGKLFTQEEKMFTEAVRSMASNKKNMQEYNEEAKERVEKLTTVVESLEQTVPEFNDQLQRFNKLRKDVEMVSSQMGGDVDNTKNKVSLIFNEIKELHIRQERIMFYQLLERILSTTQNPDEMDVAAFHRFLAQVPETYTMEEFGDSWFNRVAVHGRVRRQDFKNMIDSITLKKLVNEQ